MLCFPAKTRLHEDGHVQCCSERWRGEAERLSFTFGDTFDFSTFRFYQGASNLARTIDISGHVMVTLKLEIHTNSAQFSCRRSSSPPPHWKSTIGKLGADCKLVRHSKANSLWQSELRYMAVPKGILLHT